jgi:hypothetical protein
MQKILLLGNSHCQAVKNSEKSLEGVEIQWLKAKPGARFGDLEVPAAIERVTALRETYCLFVMHLGALHNVIGLLNHDKPFSLLAGLDAGDSAQMIPANTLRKFMMDRVKAGKLLSQFDRSARCPIAHVMPPPPKVDLAFMETSTKVYHGKPVSEYKISPPHRRLALWKMEQDVLEEFLDSIGVRHIAPPMGTMTEDGFLAPDYYARDATHANSAYGARVLDQMRQFAAGKDPAAA